MHKNLKFCPYYCVVWDKRCAIYISRVTVNKKRIEIGRNKNPEILAKMYDEFVIKHELNLRLNFPIYPENLIPNTRLIPLTCGKFTIVDDIDYDKLTEYEWYANKHKNTFYVGRNVVIDGRQTNKYIHRVIMDVSESTIQVDHIDGDGLNNQRNNLRICNNSQNQMNRKKSESNSNTYKGVTFRKNRNNFDSHIKVNGKQVYLGAFADMIDAAKAYDIAATKYFGEFAKLNFSD